MEQRQDRGQRGRDDRYESGGRVGEPSRYSGDAEDRRGYGNDGGQDEWRGMSRGQGGRQTGVWDRMGQYGEDDWRDEGGRERFGREQNTGMHRDFRSGGNSGWQGPGMERYGQQRHQGRFQGDQQDRGFWDKAGDEVSSWFGDDDAQRRREQDEHRGRGPKSYTRSDDRIREDVNDRFTDDGSLDASDIEVQVASGEVTLTGEVSRRQDKRRAEDIAEMVSGVKHVQNNLRVRMGGAESGSTGIASAARTGGPGQGRNKS